MPAANVIIPDVELEDGNEELAAELEAYLKEELNGEVTAKNTAKKVRRGGDFVGRGCCAQGAWWGRRDSPCLHLHVLVQVVEDYAADGNFKLEELAKAWLESNAPGGVAPEIRSISAKKAHSRAGEQTQRWSQRAWG